jgi:aminoglycoside 3-N-acetyltransferase
MSAITTGWPMVNACIHATETGGVAEIAPFDVAQQPTWAGTIAETFRQRPGVRRSWHPTHSVSACGPLAEPLLADHHNAPGPCGEGTPYARVTELERGFILLLGIGHSSNTTLHGLEELAGCEYVLYPKFARVPLLTPDGPAEAHTRVHLPHLGRRLAALETAYLDGRAETVTHIGDSVCRLVHGPRMRSITLAALADDPWLLLTPDGVRAHHLMNEAGNWTRNPLTP